MTRSWKRISAAGAAAACWAVIFAANGVDKRLEGCKLMAERAASRAEQALRTRSEGDARYVEPTLRNVRYGPDERNVLNFWKAPGNRPTPVIVLIHGGGWTVGVLIQANFGRRRDLVIAGVPVGREITDLMPEGGGPVDGPGGSAIVVVATDAPLLPHQLNRLARRVSMGLARTGSYAANGSGDIFLAFSTANGGAARRRGVKTVRMLPNDEMNPLLEATVQATAESVVNALLAAETMTGHRGRTVHALPHDRLKQVLAGRA